ncbi:MAG TPA: LLM class flavin-dependent oxidoreductase [Enteractinococcus helveticum]|uniref:LLM class flavin-dependent oxidoreductase n=1 Tax=Enteractinococcus helveticum TaxID=1837282 RepID=A0A921FP76_9MICC|nr:LLM class flavin-dependent oxidoreductase [Enteractinococcus helveticum]HJF15385.1 LLM class flavin-dependent oxidoreductase [Enteractinococcus helveticum]
MKFLLLTLIPHTPNPVTGSKLSTRDRFHQVVDNAILAEELGYDGFAVGERHERPFISSSPPVVLSHIAAKTQRIRLFTGVTTLSLLDPVRAFEDYATLDHLADGRLELMIGKGNGTAQRDLFDITEDEQWDRNRESYEVFHQLWRNNKITWTGTIRPPLQDAEVWPLPYQKHLRVWHGSATSTQSVDLAVRYGEPIFSANVTHPIEPYKHLVDYYRHQWSAAGHDPSEALVGAGSAGFLVRPTSQEAKALYQPVFEARHAHSQIWESYDDFLERSSALVGSPAEISEKILRYHEALGHEVMHASADGEGLNEAQHRESLELFQSDVAPIIRAAVPSRPLEPVFSHAKA